MATENTIPKNGNYNYNQYKLNIGDSLICENNLGDDYYYYIDNFEIIKDTSECYYFSVNYYDETEEVKYDLGIKDNIIDFKNIPIVKLTFTEDNSNSSILVNFTVKKGLKED